MPESQYACFKNCIDTLMYGMLLWCCRWVELRLERCPCTVHSHHYWTIPNNKEFSEMLHNCFFSSGSFNVSALRMYTMYPVIACFITCSCLWICVLQPTFCLLDTIRAALNMLDNIGAAQKVHPPCTQNNCICVVHPRMNGRTGICTSKD